MSNIETLFPINFSDSMFKDIWKCEMYFFRKYIQRLSGAGKSSDLIAGVHFAKGCEIVRKAYYNEGNSIEDSIEKGYNYIMTAEDTGCALKSNRKMAYSLGKYFRKFPLDSDLTPIKLSDGSHAIEYDFIFDLGIPHPEIPGQNICFRGKLDLLAEQILRDKTVKRYLIDEKTTKNVYRLDGTKIVNYEKEKNTFVTNSQIICYSWAARQLGINLDGAKIRRVPILKDHEDAYELDIPLNRYMENIWSITIINKIATLVEKYKYFKEKNCLPAEVFDPVYSDHCTDYSRLCEYAIGCQDKHGEDILAATHKQVVWDSEKKIEVPIKLYKQNMGIGG